MILGLSLCGDNILEATLLLALINNVSTEDFVCGLSD